MITKGILSLLGIGAWIGACKFFKRFITKFEKGNGCGTADYSVSIIFANLFVNLFDEAEGEEGTGIVLSVVALLALTPGLTLIAKTFGWKKAQSVFMAPIDATVAVADWMWDKVSPLVSKVF